MSLPPRLGLAAILVLVLLWAGCGDVFRPVANPSLRPGGDPQNLKTAVVVSANPAGLGAIAQIDVSGDTNRGNLFVGRGPVHVALLPPNATKGYVANRADDSISVFSTIFPTNVPRTITLPEGSAPIFLDTTQSDVMYVANSGTNTVGVLSATTDIQIASIPVGMTPVALLETADGKKLYVVNQGDGTVSVIDTVARTVSKTITLGHPSPIRAVISPDGAALFVLNQGDSTVSVISTTGDNIQGNALPVGAVPTFIEFDRRLKRFYVTNGGDNTVSVYKADVTPPVLLATIPVGIAPVSITALSDGSRAYVANSGCTDVVALQGCSANTVSVIDLTSLRVSKTITVGNSPVWVESAPDGSKVFVANRDSNTISDIRTLDDTVVVTLPAAAPAPVFIAVTP